jgi:hypothetical protein
VQPQPSQPQVQPQVQPQPSQPQVQPQVESKQPYQPEVQPKSTLEREKPLVEQSAPESAPADSKPPSQPDDVDNESLTPEEKFEFCADIIQSPNICNQEDDVSLQLLMESSATNDGDGGVATANSTLQKKQHKDDVLLAYPFVGGFDIEKATKVLDLCVGTGTPLDEKHCLREEIQLLRLQQVASNGRNNRVTMYKCDRETLWHGSYINDNVIDFWMCWITRKKSKSKSCVHIFTTHFYTTLLNEGIASVSRWTTRKGLDIFTKKILFIAVNLNLHWSLMAVFNAGMINADLVEDELGDPYDLEVPALIHLDSLKLHDGAVIAKNVRTWLNHEWDKKYRLTDSKIFNEQSMPLFKPKGKYLFLCSDILSIKDDY